MSVAKPNTQTQQTAQTSNVSRNLNLGDTSGITVGEAGGDVTIIPTDYNALGLASDLASQSLDVGESLGHDALDLASYFADTSNQLVRDSYDFGSAAFGTVEKALSGVSGAYQDSANYQRNALIEVADLSSRSVDAIAEANTRVLNANQSALDTVGQGLQKAFGDALLFVKGLQTSAQTQLGDTVTALNAIAVENSKSSDQRIAEISDSSIKYMAYTVGALALAGVAYAAFKRG